jgi:hypothetical protein
MQNASQAHDQTLSGWRMKSDVLPTLSSWQGQTELDQVMPLRDRRPAAETSGHQAP